MNVYLETFCNLLYSIIQMFEDDHNARPNTFVTDKDKKNMKMDLLEKDATQESAG